MKKLFLQIGIGILFLLFVAAVAQYRIRDIQGDKSGDPTLKQELANRYTKAAADTVFNMVVNNINPHDSVWYKDETYHKDTIDSKLSKKANLYQPVFVDPTANTLPVGTNTTGLATTEYLYQNYMNPIMRDMKLMGIPCVMVPLGSFQMFQSTGIAMVDGQGIGILFYVPVTTTLTGFKWILTIAGTSVFDGYNGIAIFSVSNGVATAIVGGETANDAAIWTSTANTIGTKALPEPIVLQPGLYTIKSISNWGTANTVPSFAHFGGVGGGNIGANGIKIATTEAASSFTSPYTISALSTGTIIRAIWGY